MKMTSNPRQVAEYLSEYWSSYSNQHGYESYRAKTVLDDALYGIGAAFGGHYRFANGYDQFKKDLLVELGHEDPQVEELKRKVEALERLISNAKAKIESEGYSADVWFGLDLAAGESAHE